MSFIRFFHIFHASPILISFNTKILMVKKTMIRLRKLGDSKLFRAAIFIPLAFGVSLLFINIISNNVSQFCLSSDCVNNFFELYKYPLSIMGLSVPLTAIVAALHRSEEARHQIEETIKQNTFNNYIKHKEEFLKLLEKIEKQCFCQFSDPLFLYKKIFPKNNYSAFSFEADAASKSDGTVSNNFLEELHRCPIQAAFTLRNPDTDEETLATMIWELCDMITMLRIKPAPENVSERINNKLIWSENFVKDAQIHLRVISRQLTSFSFYTYQDKMDSTRYQRDSKRPDTHEIYKKNMAAAVRITAEIERNLI